MKDEEAFLKQYEIMANTTQNVTLWRQNGNSFYLTLSTALLGFIIYTSNSVGVYEKIGMACIGIVIAILWYYTIDYYRKLNNAKFDVIGIMEKKLPIKMFDLEWKTYKKDKSKDVTQIEKYLPIVFLIVYGLSLCYYAYLILV